MNLSRLLAMRYQMIGLAILWIVVMETLSFFGVQWIDAQGTRENVFYLLAILSLLVSIGVIGSMIQALRTMFNAKSQAVWSALFLVVGALTLLIMFYAVMMSGLLLVGFS